METLRQPDLRHAIIIVRIDQGGRSIEMWNLERGEHFLFAADGGGTVRKLTGLSGFEDADLVFDGPGWSRETRFPPPIISIIRWRLEKHLRNLRRAESHAGCAFGIGAVICIIKEHPKSGADPIRFRPHVNG